VHLYQRFRIRLLLKHIIDLFHHSTILSTPPTLYKRTSEHTCTINLVTLIPYPCMIFHKHSRAQLGLSKIFGKKLYIQISLSSRSKPPQLVKLPFLFDASFMLRQSHPSRGATQLRSTHTRVGPPQI